MRNFIAIFAASLGFLFQTTAASAIEKCSALVQDGVRNYLNEKIDKNYLSEFHSAMCSEDSQRIDKAKSTGIGLEYGNFVFDFAGDSKKIAAYQKSMCESNAGIDVNSDFYELVRNFVSVDLANAYVKCVEIQSGGIIYNVTHGTDGASVNIEIGYDARLGVGGGKLNISKIVVSPSQFEEKVECVGELVDQLKDGPVDISTINGFKTITCRPKPNELSGKDNDFSVFVHTSLGIIEGYVNPYHVGKDDRIDELDGKLSAVIQSQSESLTKKIDDINAVKMSSLEFWSGCNSTSQGNVCDIVSPGCPDGFAPAHEWFDTWNGGRCGNGSKCRVCVKISK